MKRNNSEISYKKEEMDSHKGRNENKEAEKGKERKVEEKKGRL